jgi:uncharacterized cupin superfamily protein
VIAHWDEVERERLEEGEIAAWATDLGTAAGSVDVGVTRYELDPGRRSSPVHVELVEEEIFYVLGGSGFLWQNGETHEVGMGDSVVARASEHMHAFVAGDEGLDLLAFGQRADPPMTYLPRASVVRAGPLAFLAYGTREPNDICYYPRSNKFSLRGIGLIGRIQPLDYWEGED